MAAGCKNEVLPSPQELRGVEKFTHVVIDRIRGGSRLCAELPRVFVAKNLRSGLSEREPADVLELSDRWRRVAARTVRRRRRRFVRQSASPPPPLGPSSPPRRRRTLSRGAAASSHPRSVRPRCRTPRGRACPSRERGGGTRARPRAEPTRGPCPPPPAQGRASRPRGRRRRARRHRPRRSQPCPRRGEPRSRAAARSAAAPEMPPRADTSAVPS
mmetsp:Transcript_10360/g.33990  ORF Transcript_10360/g.33990 Transcript_10360/m.33990 type:complete len:215 (-) Transcript_10360:367-1011(-)